MQDGQIASDVACDSCTFADPAAKAEHVNVVRSVETKATELLQRVITALDAG